MNQNRNLYPVERLMEFAARQPQRAWLHQPQPSGAKMWTWGEALGQVARMANALKAMDLPVGSRIAISGRNTAHWFFADLAIAMAGHVSVGLYPKQAEKTTRYILDHSQARVLFLGPAEDAQALRDLVSDNNIYTIALPYAGVPNCNARWDELVDAHTPMEHYRRPTPDSLMTLVYTSGTTGNPKGVMITYGALQWSGAALVRHFPAEGAERLFSYLPLAHLLERAAVEFASLEWGAEVHFLEDLNDFAEQLKMVAPTRFFGVPLVYGRFHKGLLEQIPERRLRALMRVPLLRGWLRRKLLSGIGLHNTHACVVGSAPTPVATVKFFREVLGIELLEGYGQTENMAYCSANLPGQTRAGSVGRPFSDANVRIAEDGEIQCRHPGLMMGYYQDSKKSAEAFTADGYLCTGDKGRIDEDGYLYITGRVKDIFKTAKGKYVAPAPIEGALAKSEYIDQLCLVGSQLSQPVMLVSLTAAARKLRRPEVERWLQSDMDQVNNNLEAHEKIAKLLLVGEQWSIDEGLLTPTLKVRREAVEDRYSAQLAACTEDRERQLVWLY